MLFVPLREILSGKQIIQRTFHNFSSQWHLKSTFAPVKCSKFMSPWLSTYSVGEIRSSLRKISFLPLQCKLLPSFSLFRLLLFLHVPSFACRQLISPALKDKDLYLFMCFPDCVKAKKLLASDGWILHEPSIKKETPFFKDFVVSPASICSQAKMPIRAETESSVFYR